MMGSKSPLWKQCKAWLLSLLTNNAQLEAAQTPQQLQAALRDGLLLCLLINKLRPQTINIQRDVSLKPQHSQLLCLQNLLLFLEHCQHTFGVRSGDLFEAHELYNLERFNRTLRTISILSRKMAGRTKGFPDAADVAKYENANWEEAEPIYGMIPTAESSFVNTRTLEQEQQSREHEHHNQSLFDGANCLSMFAETLEADNDDYPHYYSVPSAEQLRSGGKKPKQLLYGHLRDYVSAEIPIKTAPAMLGADSDAFQSLKMERNAVIEELLEFEGKYAKILQTTVDVFVEHFRQTPLLPPLDFQAIFMVTPSQQLRHRNQDTWFCKIDKHCSVTIFELLLNLHNIFLHDLRQANATNSEIALCFDNIDNWYEAYAYYFSHVDAAQVQLKLLQSVNAGDNPFSAAMQFCQKQFNAKSVKKSVNAEGVWRMPFDQVTRYTELLKRLNLLTANLYGNERTFDLIRATNKIHSFLQFANDLRGEMNQMEKIRQIQANIQGLPSDMNLLAAGQKREDGKIRLTKNSARTHHAFLFDKCFIICSSTTDPRRFIFQRSLILSEWTLTMTPPVSNSNDWNYAWNLSKAGETIEVYSQKSNDRDKWLASTKAAKLQSTMAKIGLHELICIAYATEMENTISKCAVCAKYIINHANMCRLCGLNVHFSCRKKLAADQTKQCSIGADIEDTRWKRPEATEFPWWGGCMSGNKATEMLSKSANGTFMIRHKDNSSADPRGSDDNRFLVSSFYSGMVAHLFITSTDNQKHSILYGDHLKQFSKLEDIADWLMVYEM